MASIAVRKRSQAKISPVGGILKTTKPPPDPSIPRPRKRVRFEGLASSWMLSFTSFIIRYCRPGSTAAVRWEMIVALACVLDIFVIPLALAVDEHHTAKVHYITGKKGYVAHEELFGNMEMAFDSVFISDLLFQVAQGMAIDMGFQENEVDKILAGAEFADETPSEARLDSDILAQSVMSQDVSIFGPNAADAVFRRGATRLAFMMPLWITRNLKMPLWVTTLAGLLRLYRMRDFLLYINARQQDMSCPIKFVAFAKFAFIISATGHWLGCVYYYLAAQSEFSVILAQMNWVDAWVRATFVDFNWVKASTGYQYAVRSHAPCMYGMPHHKAVACVNPSW